MVDLGRTGGAEEQEDHRHGERRQAEMVGALPEPLRSRRAASCSRTPSIGGRVEKRGDQPSICLGSAVTSSGNTMTIAVITSSTTKKGKAARLM